MGTGFDYAALLEEVVAECRSHAERGQLPTYIPELKKGNPKLAGIALQTTTGCMKPAIPGLISLCRASQGVQPAGGH